jgi:hypothetical protein
MERLLRFNIVGTLTISAILQNGSKRITRNVVIENVYYVPTLSATLLSVSRLVHSGHVVRFMHNEWSITKGKEHNELLRAVATNGVYEVTTSETPEVRREIGSAMVAALRASVSLETWHRRLGHLNIADCRRLAASKAVRGVVISQITEPHVCRTCALAKVTTASAPAVRSSSDSVADIVCHLDLSGPVKRSYHGNEYFMVIVWRGYVRVYRLRSKNNASDRAEEFLRFIERQAQVSATSIKTVRTDGGTEFLGEDFRKLVTDEGLHHQHTTRYRSSQNGVAERSIRTLTEMAAAMLIDSHLPHYLGKMLYDTRPTSGIVFPNAGRRSHLMNAFSVPGHHWRECQSLARLWSFERLSLFAVNVTASMDVATLVGSSDLVTKYGDTESTFLVMVAPSSRRQT